MLATTSNRSDCSGLLGRTSLRHTKAITSEEIYGWILFRPSRPDFIETENRHSSGQYAPELFRPSRPDFIETHVGLNQLVDVRRDCSGLLGRTSLRLVVGVLFDPPCQIVPAF